MSHTFFVTAAYGAAVLALGALIGWIIADHRGRKRELRALEASGIRRRSDNKAGSAR